MSNFAFLAAEFPAVHEAAVEAERQAGVSPTAAAFFAGKAVEVAVKWAFRTDPGSEAALSGQYRRAAARAELPPRGGRGGVCQGAIHQHAAQSRGARRKDHQPRRRHGRGEGAVSRLLLARPHLCAQGQAGRRSRLRCLGAVAPRRGAEEGLRPTQGAAGRARRQERRTDEAARRQAEPRR